MKKNNKGFTLVELLAVIVILGLLMAIAIPSVTKYITQSRKKTLISSIDSYITAVTTAVNDNEFGPMSKEDTIYYVPVSDIESSSCVSLEKGGSDPFGNWKEAYVVVNYDAKKYSYDYYFTFYDDAGYGMELTKVGEISATGNIITNPSPVNAENITSQKNDRSSNIKVLLPDSCKIENAITGGNIQNDKITFKILDNSNNKTNTYTCDKGMTWGEFMDSDYNIPDSNGYYLNTQCDNNVGFSNGSSFKFLYNDFGHDRVEKTEVIISNFTYTATMVTEEGKIVGGGCN